MNEPSLEGRHEAQIKELCVGYEIMLNEAAEAYAALRAQLAEAHQACEGWEIIDKEHKAALAEKDALRAAADAMASAIDEFHERIRDGIARGSIVEKVVQSVEAYRALSPGERIEPQTVNPGVPV